MTVGDIPLVSLNDSFVGPDLGHGHSEHGDEPFDRAQGRQARALRK